MSQYNLVQMTTATTGTGTITLGSATTGFLSFTQAGVPNGAIVTYGIIDGNNREAGLGTYNSGAGTLTRSTIFNSTNGNSALNLSGNAIVFLNYVNNYMVGNPITTISGTNVYKYQNFINSTDTQPSFAWDSNGELYWGPGGSTAYDTNLYRSAANALTTDSYFTSNIGFQSNEGSFYVASASNTSLISFETSLVADSHDRFNINLSGIMGWGTGSSPTDTNLYRAGAGVLQTDGYLEAGTGVQADDGGIWSQRAAANFVSFAAYVNGDPDDRWHAHADGKQEWGTGVLAPDTNLYRNGVGQLRTDYVFMPGQYATASAPSYIKGGMYFDTTLNKLRIGGATAWETVTSA